MTKEYCFSRILSTVLQFSSIGSLLNPGSNCSFPLELFLGLVLYVFLLLKARKM